MGGSECVCLCVCLCAYQVNVTACKESPCAASARHTSSIDGITERKKTLEEEKEQLSSRTTAWFAGQGESAITILFRLQSSGFLVAEYGFYV